MSSRPICALSIAGSDSGGGAGIQADLKTFAAHGVHGLSALAAITAQNTCGVRAVHVPPVTFLRQQIDACFEDFDIGAVKIGMLANARVIDAVATALQHWKPKVVILDPVMIASSGARLLESGALKALVQRLFPLATLITPNIPEAELLIGQAIDNDAQAELALDSLRALGASAVLLKGGHLTGARLTDRLDNGGERFRFVHRRLKREGHGTGCSLASAIAANACLGMPLAQSCQAAVHYIHGALRSAYRPGTGNVSVLDHFWQQRPGR